MIIAFRVDSSVQIGVGHLMRCLALANSLRKRGATCIFLSRNLYDHSQKQIISNGHLQINIGKSEANLKLNSDGRYSEWLGVSIAQDINDTISCINDIVVDWLIVDHYSLDAAWEVAIKQFCKKIFVIDDLICRKHDADLLLNQNLGFSKEVYLKNVPSRCKFMIGPRYALLRPDFEFWRQKTLNRQHSGTFKNILISFGGVDNKNITSEVLEALIDCAQIKDSLIKIVVGHSSPWKNDIIRKAKKLPFKADVLVGVNNMAELMLNADLAIGAAGSTSWERCCMGLPTIQTAVSENQIQIAKALDEIGAAVTMRTSFIREDLWTALSNFHKDKTILKRMSKISSKIVDGQGVNRVASFLIGF